MSNINQLESLNAFKAVVECKSFSKAAQELKVSISWVSKRVNRLEEALQTKLLNRSTRHLGLTSSGTHCYEQAIAMLALWDDLCRDMSGIDTALEGQIRISAPMSWGLVQLGPLMNKFSEIYPGVTFDMRLSDQHVNVIAEKFDLVLRIAEGLEDSSLLSRKIKSYRRVLCASPELIQRKGRPENLDNLNSFYPLVYSLDDRPVSWKFFEGKQMFRVKMAPYVISNNSLLLKSHLVAGDGLALIPEFLVESELRNGSLIELLPGYRASSLHLYSLRPGGRAATNRLNVFLDFIYQELGS